MVHSFIPPQIYMKCQLHAMCYFLGTDTTGNRADISGATQESCLGRTLEARAVGKGKEVSRFVLKGAT